MHLDDEAIQRLLHGELEPAAAEVAERHLADCADCRRRLEEARQQEARIFGLLRRVDHGLPPVSVEAVVSRARGARPRWLLRAATILLALAVAGTAYAIPGSPLRAWLEAIARSVTGPAQEPSPPDQAQPAGAPTAGISVAPGPRFTIRFTASQPSGIVTVYQGGGPDVVVRALHGNATFAMGEDGLVIDNRGSAASYEIVLPRRAPWIEITLGPRRLLLQQGGRVTGTPAGADQRYLLSLAAPPE